MYTKFCPIGLMVGILLGATSLFGQDLFNEHKTCNSWEAHPQGSQIAKEKHQMYRDLFNSKQYKMAFPIWSNLFKFVQAPQEAPSRHFKDGIKMYKEFAKTSKNKDQKEEWVDTLILLYNQLAICTGEKALDRAWQGYDIYSLRGNPEKAMAAFERALSLGENESPSMIFVPMAQLSVYLFQQKKEKFTADYLQTLFYQLKKIADYNIKKKTGEAEKYQKKWKKAYQEFYKIKDQLPEIWGCDFYCGELKPMYESDSNNIEQNKTILQVLRKHCSEEHDFYQRVSEHQKALFIDYCEGIPIEKLSHYKKGTCRETQAIRFLKHGDSTQYEQYLAMAFKLYIKAVEEKDTSVSDDKMAALCYRLAYEEYQKGDFEKARTLCRKASDYKPNWGEPYLLVGSMYASSSQQCAGESQQNWNAKTVLWPAMDEWEKAMRVDVAAKEKGTRYITKYKPYLPTHSEAFQHSLGEGDAYSVACWIKQKTKVRVINN